MSKKYIIALDQGTTSCRALLVDLSGKIQAKTQQEFTQIFPQPGWVEHNPEEIIQVQTQVLEDLITEAGLRPEQITSIGITNQRETTVVWNKTTGKPVYNAIVWQDKRTSAYCKELKESGLESYVKSKTGLPIDAYFSGTKLKWILDKVGRSDELLFGTIDSWLIWNLTEGQSHVTDYTNASRTMLFDIGSLDWDETLLSKLSIPSSVLPRVQASASHFGNWKYKGHQIPINGVAGDQQAALFGQACFDAGSAKNTYGTGCFMLMNIGSEMIHSESGLLTTLACDKTGQPCYALEGSIFMAGATVQWLRDGLSLIKDSSETEQMATSVADQHEVIMVPAFAGLGAPYWDMDARGAIYGMTRGTTSAHLAKAALDAIAYRTRDVIDAMLKDSQVQLSTLKVDGGAVKNNYLMQFQSDLLQVHVERPSNIESTAMGAAFLAGMTSGVWTHTLIRDIRTLDKTYKPTMESVEADRLYEMWKIAVERTLTSSGDN
jgi:glycerol kinase